MQEVPVDRADRGARRGAVTVARLSTFMPVSRATRSRAESTRSPWMMRADGRWPGRARRPAAPGAGSISSSVSCTAATLAPSPAPGLPERACSGAGCSSAASGVGPARVVLRGRLDADRVVGVDQHDRGYGGHQHPADAAALDLAHGDPAVVEVDRVADLREPAELLP